MRNLSPLHSILGSKTPRRERTRTISLAMKVISLLETDNLERPRTGFKLG